ncbi:hypothetical protein C8F01DRAFT_2945 [Mycena amicta]|nr:hypothetical protein C8F01DRAFT_2945 [Mycena amicta]
MSISILKSQSLGKIKWIPVQPEPTNSSLISAVLPDDILIPIVQLAAQEDVPTALTLAVTSKAIGRAAEIVIYRSVTLDTVPGIRLFSSTLRTKSRHILASIISLTLALATPPLFDDFWALVSARCIRLERLSIRVDDIDALLREEMRICPRHLSVFQITPSDEYWMLLLNPSVVVDPEPERIPPSGYIPHLWSRLSHLHLPGVWIAPFKILRVLPEQLPLLTHVSCAMTMVMMMPMPPLTKFWEEVCHLPALRVCVIQLALPREYFVGTPLGNDRRVVAICYGDNEPGLEGPGPHWEYAERKIAERRR